MINQSTLDFIGDLKANNDRDWFLKHKEAYDAAQQNVVTFTGELLKELSKVDPYIDANSDPKKSVMRIYRDIRFSKDKTPYKHWFGIHKLSAKYHLEVGYYMHIEPGATFIAGGCWWPQGDQLKAIRQEIDYNADDLKAIVDAPTFKKLFGEFRDQEQLKTIPNGYEADNENISLIKLKSFTASHKVSDAELKSKDAAAKVASILKEIQPLLLFLQNAIA
ncbi:DUF2461 domain-containing protein [Mucilaginibacter myungsuensis]|uniref:DUF2461 domain-containing protein n=1 Tax=Mucilaginibacter myungsuensis TaxID=649104 RepID=A0A929KZ89_9SPHI|nr:DUF2461 domain-containing protein [Mucilaginibacter myungsuensis]MBE9664434.1 DUF2461 domain-containing protein [Mucilaginibacter myungsuensis]MDN3601421.1 DUF2461 domain-containing protein [Mucilaginibacter myungsuensis]